MISLNFVKKIKKLNNRRYVLVVEFLTPVGGKASHESDLKLDII